jgi:hypothetical protein
MFLRFLGSGGWGWVRGSWVRCGGLWIGWCGGGPRRLAATTRTGAAFAVLLAFGYWLLAISRYFHRTTAVIRYALCTMHYAGGRPWLVARGSWRVARGAAACVAGVLSNRKRRATSAGWKARYICDVPSCLLFTKLPLTRGLRSGGQRQLPFCSSYLFALLSARSGMSTQTGWRSPRPRSPLVEERERVSPNTAGNYGPAHPISQARRCKLSSVLLLIAVN